MTRAIDAAAQGIAKLLADEAGGCFRPDGEPQGGECADGDCYCVRQCSALSHAALRAALPAEPPTDVVDAIALGMVGGSRYLNSRRAYRAIRAYLLGEAA